MSQQNQSHEVKHHLTNTKYLQQITDSTKSIYPLRLVLGLLPGVAVLAYEGAAPLATARAVSFLSLAMGLLSFLLLVLEDAGLFQ